MQHPIPATSEAQALRGDSRLPSCKVQTPENINFGVRNHIGSDVVPLQEKALTRIHCGQIAQAEAYLKQALECLPPDTSSYPLTSAKEGPGRASKCEGDSEGKFWNLTKKTSHVPSESDEDLEYDEGMAFFVPCIPIGSPTSGTRCMRSILFQNLATTLVAMQKFDEALSYFNRSLMTATKAERVSTLHRLVAVASMVGMGNLYFKSGQIDNSVDCFKGARRVLDADTNIDRTLMAVVQNCLGVLQFHSPHCDVESAAALFRQALTIQKGVFGANTSTVATTMNNLGRVLCIGRHFEEALQVYLEAYHIRVATLGNDHLDVSATAYNIGQTYHQMANFEQALEYYDHFIRVGTRKLGYLHKDVALTLRCIAQIYQEYRRFDESLSIYQVALHGARKSLGQHAEVASILNKMGNIYFQKDDLDAALEAYQMGLRTELSVLDDNHPNVAITLCNIGLILHRKGDLSAACSVYSEAICIQLRVYEGNDPRTASSWMKLGHVQLQMRDYTNALESYQEALQIYRSFGTAEDLNIASTLNSVGLVLFKMDIHELALRAFTECLRLRLARLSATDREVGIPMYNMAMIFQTTGRNDEAILYFEEVSKVERLNGDQDASSTLSCLAQLYESRGDLEEAIVCYKGILKNLNRDTMEDAPMVVQALMALANLHLRFGETVQLIEYASRALRLCIRLGKDCNDFTLAGFFFYDLSKICPMAAAEA